MSDKIFQEEFDCIKDVREGDNEGEHFKYLYEGEQDEKEESELECPVCYNLCMPPRIPRCENGHLICYTCKCKLPTPLCPVCRGRFLLRRPLIAEAVAKLIPFPCRNAGKGCLAQLPWRTRQIHEVECEYQRFYCPLLTCPTETESVELLQDHVEQVHRAGPSQGMLSFYKEFNSATMSTYISPDMNMMVIPGLRFFWWQPQIFLKELPCFFMVLREVDSQNMSTYFFWLWMAAAQSETENFQYRICIEDPNPTTTPREGGPLLSKSGLLVNFVSAPVSLQTSIDEIQDLNLCLKLTEDQFDHILTDGGPNCDQGCHKDCQHMKYTVLLRKQRRPRCGSGTPVPKQNILKL